MSTGLHLHIKKTRIITIEETYNFNVDSEDTGIIKDFAGSVINSETTSEKSREAETPKGSIGRIMRSPRAKMGY